MRPRTQKQPQVKKEPCWALDDVDVDADVDHRSRQNVVRTNDRHSSRLVSVPLMFLALNEVCFKRTFTITKLTDVDEEAARFHTLRPWLNGLASSRR